MRTIFAAMAACPGGCLDDDGQATAPGAGDAISDQAVESQRGFAGSASCVACHAEISAQWKGSHHDLAMQVADTDTVLGDFEDARFVYHGVETHFYHEGDEHFIRTDGPDGVVREYRVAYTFGVYPLQQYLIAFPGGRYQALGICWDSRPAETGGQRWFHLYPDHAIAHDDALHWTGPNQNWNFMCAECHSTDLHKNFDLATNTYDTTWSEINVACEACHGPAAEHVAWARAHQTYAATIAPEGNPDAERSDPAAIGLPFHLKEPTEGRWRLEPSTGRYTRTPPLTSNVQVEMCGRCHARRRLIHEPYEHGHTLMATHDPALLREGLYHADGQILDEVYAYGSFVQSKMYHHGVRCTDCHDPHSLTLRAPGNALCTQCHLSDRYDTPSHHFHEATSRGASCVACHMPAQTYMVVDPRRDHSIRVPRPDLSLTLGTPNACNQCHHDRDARWAADAMTTWYGANPRETPHYGEILHAGRKNLAGAAERLVALVRNAEAPAIARGTALSLLVDQASHLAQTAIRDAVRDTHPLLRRSALQALEPYPPSERVAMAAHLLQDPVRAVRIEAARLLAPIQPGALDPAQRTALSRATAEYISAQAANAERPESHLNLGNLYLDLNRADDAESAYLTAIRIDPQSVQAHVNLADLYRSTAREEDCERTLRRALAIDPDVATTQHALGLALVRQGRREEALAALESAVRMDPDTPHFALVHAVALHDTGHAKAAFDTLETAWRRHPHDRQLLATLIQFHQAEGTRGRALFFATKLLALDPKNSAVQNLVRQLQHDADTGAPHEP